MARHYNRALRALPTENLICRDRTIGHAWEDTHGGDDADPTSIVWKLVRRKDGGHRLVREIRCTRCTTTKRVTYTHADGGYIKKVGASYRIAKGYSVARADRPSATDVATELHRRAHGGKTVRRVPRKSSP